MNVIIVAIHTITVGIIHTVTVGIHIHIAIVNLRCSAVCVSSIIDSHTIITRVLLVIIPQHIIIIVVIPH